MQKRTKKIQAELTSQQGENWTWRKVGAREPKGEILQELLPPGVKPGDEVHLEILMEIDGIVVESASPIGQKPEKETNFKALDFIEDKNFELVKLNSKKSRSSKKARKPKKKPVLKKPDSKVEPKKSAPKLLAKHAHRKEWIDSLPEEQKPIAEKLSSSGLPGLRSSIEKDPDIKSGKELLELAEKLLPAFRLAEWQDRADAALEGIEKIRLQDLRSVLAAAEGLDKKFTKKAETMEFIAKLREKLNERVEAEHTQWLLDISTLLEEGRIIRALNLSGFPPKAGSPMPGELAQKLVERANLELNVETPPKRWISFIEAISKSPVAAKIVPSGIPDTLSSELMETAKRLQRRIPQIATLLLQKKT